MFTCRRKEPPPSAHLFSRFWDIAQMKLLVVKSSVHFRAAFTPVASHILVAKAAGPMAADPADLPWRKLPASMGTSVPGCPGG
jgi:microcystin degradation protein MlrC